MNKFLVNGIWKSGNHLIYSILNSVNLEGPSIGFSSHLLNGKYSYAKKIIRSINIIKDDAIDIGLDTKCHIRASWIIDKIKKNKNNIIGSHIKYTEQIDDLITKCKTKKILIMRDPRDILLSFCDWIKRERKYYLNEFFNNKKDSEIVKNLLDGFIYKKKEYYPFDIVLKNYDGWLNSKKKIILKFEDLISSDNELRSLNHSKLLNFLDLDKKYILKKEDYFGNSKTFSIGKAERWKDYFDKKLIKNIEDKCIYYIDKWGYRSSDL